MVATLFDLTTDQLATIGNIAITYNEIEDLIKVIAGMKLGSTDAAYLLARKLSNRDRIDLLNGLIAEQPGEIEIRAAYKAALSHFEICSENRNIILHSTHRKKPKDEGVGQFSKWASGKPDRKLHFSVETETLDRIAQEMNETLILLLNTMDYETFRATGSPSYGYGPRSLPQTPQQPRKLIPHPHPITQKDGQPPA